MRRQLTSILIGLTVIAAVACSVAVAASGLPKVIIGSYSGIKPKTVAFSGDGGNIVGKIKWAHWNRSGAVGHGISDIQGCVPNCAAGSETPVATTVTFSEVKDGHFTKVVELRDGMRLVGTYRHDTWPEGAQ